jgi:hypothetical protein
MGGSSRDFKRFNRGLFPRLQTIEEWIGHAPPTSAISSIMPGDARENCLESFRHALGGPVRYIELRANLIEADTQTPACC